MGAILISGADIGALDGMTHKDLIALMADNLESLAGVTVESMADEVTTHAKAFSFDNAVTGLTKIPVLVLSANDGLAPTAEKLVAAIRANGGQRMTETHAATDHAWSDHRIFLESVVIIWLAGLK